MNADRVLDNPAMAVVNAPQSNQQVSSRRRLFVLVVLASLAYLVALIYYTHTRPLDGDEGYYTTAARLVWEGKVPYKDFAYPQGVLLPYLYSWIWAAWPHSLVAMRALSATCAAAATLLWGLWLAADRRLSDSVVLTALGLVLLNPYWLWWNTAVKTFAVANLQFRPIWSGVSIFGILPTIQ